MDLRLQGALEEDETLRSLAGKEPTKRPELPHEKRPNSHGFPWVSLGFCWVCPGVAPKNTRSFSFTLAWSASVKWKAVKKFVCLLHMYIQTCVCLKMAPPKLVFPAMGFQEVPPNHPRGVARSPRESPKQTNLGNLFFGGRGVFCGFRKKNPQLCPEGLFCRVPFWGVLTGTQKVKPAFWRSP